MKLTNKYNFYFGVIAITIMVSVAFASCRKKTEKITECAVFVANEDGGTISVIDAIDYSLISEISLDQRKVSGRTMYMPHNVQVAPNGKTVWVTGVPMHGEDHGDEQVIVIDANKRKIKERIKVGHEQHLAHVVFDAESKFAYVTASEANQVIKINVDKQKEEARYDLGSGHKPHGLRYSKGYLFVANMDGKSVSVIELSSGKIQEISVGGVAVQTAVTNDEKYAFVSLYDTKEIVRIERTNNALVRIPLPIDAQGPIQLYCTPDSRLLYVCDQGGLLDRPVSNKVYVIDIATSTIINTIVVGNKSHGVVIDEAGAKAYVTNTGDNTVSVIDIASQTVVKTIAVGQGPNGISCWHNRSGGKGGMP